MRIEFVEARLPSRRAWSVVLAIGALAAAVFAAGRVMAVRARAPEAARIVQVVDVPNAVAPRPVPVYDAQARHALDRAEMAWSDSLAQLEGASVDGVRLRSIAVDAGVGRVTAELGVRDDRSLNDYVDELNAGLPRASWIVDSVSLDGAHATASDVFTTSSMTATIAATFKTIRAE